MGKLAQVQGVKFYVRMLVSLLWSDGTLLVPAGAVGAAVIRAVGAAVIRWTGREPGWFVEFDGYAMVGIRAAGEGTDWERTLLARSQRPN